MPATRTLFGLTLAFSSVLLTPAFAQGRDLTSRSSFAMGAEFSNDSNHLLIGNAFDRRLAGLDVTYSLLLRGNRFMEWAYDAELRPVVFIQDPVSTTTETVQFGSQQPDGPFVIQDGPIPKRCTSSVTSSSGQPGVTVVETRVCGTRWTYSGGVSPLGQRFTFLPQRRVKPYALFNAGFLLATRDLPSDDSSAFNFTFAFGAGLAFALEKGHSLAVDYRIHHLSNRALGDTNPGLDSQVVRLSYSWQAKHGQLARTNPQKSH